MEFNAYWTNGRFSLTEVDHGPYDTLEEVKEIAVLQSRIDPDDALIVWEGPLGSETCAGFAFQGNWYAKEG